MEDLSSALENLQIDYDEKCDELAEVRAELKAARIEVQQLRLRLQAAGVKNTSVVPDKIQAGPGSGDGRAAELGRHLQWIAEHVELEHPAVLDAGCDVVMGGRHVHLGRIKQFRLNCPGNLKLSVPLDQSAEIGALLAAAKLSNNTIDAQKSQSLSDEWELVVSETADGNNRETCTLLVHRETSAGILVATWPNVPARIRPFGDRVEVQYEGEWFTGTLWDVENGSIAHVQCDLDPPEVLTVVPISMLRFLKREQASSEKPCQGIASTDKQNGTLS